MMLPEGSVIGGFISKVINDVIDVSKHKIKEADKNRKSKSQNIQTRIYQVIIDAINELTNSRYKGQDELYDTAEILLNEFKSGNNNRIEGIRNSLRNLNSLIDNGTCERFIEVLRCEIEKEENFDLYKEILLVLLEDATKYNQSEHQQIKLQLEQINEKLDRNEKNRENQNISIHKKIKSRTQEYADKWNDNMFLNDFDEWDEDAGVNVKLREVYLDEHLPHFIYGENKNESTDLKRLLTQYIEKVNENKMLLILGQPGIGKSTLITWITANFESRLDDILVYQFASDFKDIEWENHNMSENILKKLGLSYNDLHGKILVLDGYDEINVRSDRKEILDQLYWDLVKNNTIKNFSLIVTCRANYIKKFERVRCTYITLQPWNEEQIKSFCNIFQLKTKKDISENTIENMLINKEILGVPLILYMVLALNISGNSEGSIVDVYDKIFSLEGGIYDRCINNKSFAEIHRIGHIKEQIHQISRETALWIFENNPDEACIPQEEYRNICGAIKNNMKVNEDIERDSLIGNFFELKHCEGEDEEELYFVHRSIYEYFVVEYFFCSICEVIDLSKKELAGVLGRFLKGNILNRTMLEYLKIIKSKPKKIHHAIEAAFDLMLQDGMTYYTGLPYKNVIHCEMNVFANMLEILHLWEQTYYIVDDTIYKYLQCSYQNSFNLVKMNLQEMNLERVNLKNADLASANLKKTYLTSACLMGANLIKADLSEAQLTYANLRNVYLEGADLRNANLREVNMVEADLSQVILVGTDLGNANLKKANLSGADLRGANLTRTELTGANLKCAILNENQIVYLESENNYNLENTAVYISTERKIISYKKYYEKRYNLS